MTMTTEAMKQAQHLLRWTQFGECRAYPGPVKSAREVDKLLTEAIAAEEAQGGELVAITLETAPVGTKAPAIMGGAWCKMDRGWKWNGPDGTGGTFPRPGGDWTGEFIAPPANTKFLAIKLELMTAERDKLQLELGDLRALRARRPDHDNPTQIGGPDDWAIAGIEVKIGDGGPNFHLYRLLGANELEPGVYELFTRPAKPPTGERAALVGRLRGLVDAARLRGPGFAPCLTCDDVSGIADMLAADAQQSAQLTEAVDANARLLVRMEGLKRAQQVAVPQGWKPMPTEPTKAMWKAAGDAVVTLQQTSTLHHDKISDAMYRAMLAAAPQPLHGACDSPELCKLNGECAGQYGTKQKCTDSPQPPQADALAADHVEDVRRMAPMTENQIHHAKFANSDGSTISFSRAIEQHHGIGVKP